jgi:hypothetical protein
VQPVQRQWGMLRTVTAAIACTLDAPASLELQIAVAAGYNADEAMSMTVDGHEVEMTVIVGEAGSRIHLVDVPGGRLELRYRAVVRGEAAAAEASELDQVVYARPSRYAESDRLSAFAAAEFGGLQEPSEVLASVSSWVGSRLDYVPGSSGPMDGAATTLLARAGVCRDYAHLTVALLRARDIPARLVAVYAPGLAPMDFHAVAEALIDGTWRVVDATLLAPRSSLVRIATGRDAADTAFLTNRGGHLTLDEIEVSAVVDGDLPSDDVHRLVSIR